jgi:hypothetical protein
MTYEEFESAITEHGFGIVGMNHYSLNGRRHLYCAIMHDKNGFALVSEHTTATIVFGDLVYRVRALSSGWSDGATKVGR